MKPPLELVRGALRTMAAYKTPPDPPPIKLDANESPWPLPPHARERLREVLSSADLHRYPDLGAREVKRLLAARLGASPDELVLGVGSDEVIGMLMAALSEPRPGAERASVVIPTPSFVMVPLTANVHGLTPVEVPLVDGSWALDRPAMLEAIARARPNLVYVATPNNPTGNAMDDGDLRAIVEAASESLVLIDEAYGPFASSTHGAWCADHPNVTVLGTLSKIGLAGLRLGWARLSPALAAEVEKARPPYNLSTYTQLTATTILGELPAVLDDAVARIVAERERLPAALSTIGGVRAPRSQANFLLVEVEDAARVHAGLAERGIAVRRFASEPRLARYLRITVGTPAEDDALLEALRELV